MISRGPFANAPYHLPAEASEARWAESGGWAIVEEQANNRSQAVPLDLRIRLSSIRQYDSLLKDGDLFYYRAVTYCLSNGSSGSGRYVARDQARFKGFVECDPQDDAQIAHERRRIPAPKL